MNSRSVKSRLKVLKTMGFGIMILCIILVLSIIGTILPQGEAGSYYAEAYSDYIAELILIMGLNHIYTSWFFTLLFSALVVNLLLCSITRISKIISNIKMHQNLNSMKEISTYKLIDSQVQPKLLRQIFMAYGANGLLGYKSKDGVFYSSRNIVGYFGSWMLHLGIMLVILFYIYGQATFFTSEIYGVPGQLVKLEGTDYKAAIRSFDVSYREDGSIAQYTTGLELLDDEGRSLKQSSLNVNNPFRYKGYSFYQTSTGWAADCRIYKEGLFLKNEVVFERAAISVPEENIAVALTRFYPDFAADANGFYTLSDRPNNPVSLYAVYYRNELVKMDIIKPGDEISWNEYSIGIDNFRRYTYLKVNKMQGQVGAAFGGLLITLGLVLNFYLKPKAIAIKPIDELLIVYGRTAPEGNTEKTKINAAIQGCLSNKEEVIDVR